MAKFSLEDIKKTVDKLASIVNTPSDLLHTYGYTKDMAYPHIELDELGQMHYVVVERGEELERKSTTRLDELLY